MQRRPGVELVDALTRLAHQVSPDELLAGRARGDYQGLRGARIVAASLTDPSRGTAGHAGCPVIARKTPADRWSSDPVPTPGGQPDPHLTDPAVEIEALAALLANVANLTCTGAVCPGRIAAVGEQAPTLTTVGPRARLFALADVAADGWVR